MTQTSGVTTAMTNLFVAQETFGLRPTAEPSFFREWQESLPELSASDRALLDRWRDRYRYYQAAGAITESTVNLILVAPLLEWLGLHEPPFLVRGEKYVRIEIEDGDRLLDGLIDILVLRDNLWLIVLETKRYGFSVLQALPQTLAYLMAEPEAAIAYGLITTGEDFLFVKVDRDRGEYDLSDKLTLATRHGNQLYTVAQILQRLLAIAS